MNASAREPRELPATLPASVPQAQAAGRQRLAELIGRLLAQRWLSTRPTSSPGDSAEVPRAPVQRESMGQHPLW